MWVGGSFGLPTFFIAPQTVWVTLNDDDAFPFDDGKIFKKVAKGACNFGNMVYSMSSYGSSQSTISKGDDEMKIDSVLVEKVKSEYRKYYSGTKFDESGYKWAVSNIGGVVEFDNGLLLVIEKPRIKTDFCFGYGQNGVSDEESYRFAVEGSKDIKQKLAFINANLRMFDREYGYLLEGKLFYFRLRRNCRSNPVGIVRVASVENLYYCQDGFVSDNDRKKIAEEVGRMREDFKKRLETYWKRYGARCLRSSVYLVD